ncbi:MAG: leucine-rich repeat protein [Clostridiales bacterium]|nr:leucine-rich repeat protein [Clostridiales bacterium]
MKRLKVTSALLSVVMCVSMAIAPVTVMADETEVPSETETTETEEEKGSEKPAPKEEEKQEPEKEEPAEEEPESEDGEEQVPGDEDSQDAMDAVLAKGKCGKKVKWSLDKKGTLKITGKGSMYGYSFDPSTYQYNTPWVKYTSNIKKIVVSKGVTTIGDYAFAGCLNVTSVSLPKGLKIICYGAFCGCSSLKKITIPKSVRRIDNYAFCESGIESFTIPKGVTEIKEAAFAACYNLKSISIPSTVTKIGVAAFNYCQKLTSVTIPSSVKEIEYYAFAECKNLKTVKIPVSGLNSIGVRAFDNCQALESFNVPLSVTFIGGYAFGDCKNLAKVWISTTQKNNAIDSFEGSSNVKFDEHAYAIIGEQLNGGNITYIVTNPAAGGSAGTVAVYGFSSTDEKIVVPNVFTFSKDGGKTKVTYKVTKITNIASQFNDTIALKALVIGSNVAVITDGAFANCQKLESVTGGAGLKTIGAKTFANCPNLKVFTINSKVLSKIGAGAFGGDVLLTTLNIKKTTKLTKAGVKNSLAGSSVKTVKVKKKKVKKYKKFFKKKNSGKSVKVKK